MQRDFHFYVIGMLANHAGYSDEEAIVIATASQYVDHATESFPIEFDDGRIVETTMTAHYHVQAFKPSVQRKVFMCFHFPPEGRTSVDGKPAFSYRTRENAPIINGLLKQIMADNHEGTYEGLMGTNGIPFCMYRLGIAMHTLADSWSHRSFTGRHNRENDVGKIWFKKGKKFEPQTINDWKWDIAPAIGHLECGHYPDQPFRIMKYGLYDLRDKKFKIRTRTNPIKFKNAAKACLKWLNQFKGNGGHKSTAWDETQPAMTCVNMLIKMKNEEAKDRIGRLKNNKLFDRHYRKLFNEKNDYNQNRWRKDAIIPKEPKDPWGETKRRELLRAQPKPGFEKSSFRLFHKAAKLQRAYVLDQLFW